MQRFLGKKTVVLTTVLCGLTSILGCKPEEDRIRDREAKEKAAAESASQPPMPNQVAKAGVGKEGQSLKDVNPNSPGGMLAAPIKAYFNVKQKAVFEIQLVSQMNAFKAIHGRAPKSHEEYMKEVVTDMIKLPKLPDGMIYRYHPETEELWVEAANSPSSGGSESQSGPPSSPPGE